MDINEKVTLSNYIVDWKEQFNKEKEILSSIFSNIHIEHIGSTSIEGMVSKPIIDIMIGFSSYPPTKEIIKKIEKLGYYNFGEIDKINGRFYFTKRGIHSFNIQLVSYKGVLWDNNIFFRNYLISHKNDLLEYANLKIRSINNGFDTLLSYSKEKEDFIGYNNIDDYFLS